MTANFLIAHHLFPQLIAAVCLTGATSALLSRNYDNLEPSYTVQVTRKCLFYISLFAFELLSFLFSKNYQMLTS